MNSYFIVKWIHIVSSVIMVGTGFGSALYMFTANRFGDLAAKRFVSRLVVRVDWIFTLPAVIVQPVSGAIMMHMAGWPLSTPWLLVAIALYLLVGACWLPVLWLQIRMERMTETCFRRGTALPDGYRKIQRWWEGLGYVGFGGAMAIFFLMTVKPWG